MKNGKPDPCRYSDYRALVVDVGENPARIGSAELDRVVVIAMTNYASFLGDNVKILSEETAKALAGLAQLAVQHRKEIDDLKAALKALGRGDA